VKYANRNETRRIPAERRRDGRSSSGVAEKRERERERERDDHARARPLARGDVTWLYMHL